MIQNFIHAAISEIASGESDEEDLDEALDIILNSIEEQINTIFDDVKMAFPDFPDILSAREFIKNCLKSEVMGKLYATSPYSAAKMILKMAKKRRRERSPPPEAPPETSEGGLFS